VDEPETWIRGGNWNNGASASLSNGNQNNPDNANNNIGFRCGR